MNWHDFERESKFEELCLKILFWLVLALLVFSFIEAFAR